MSLGQPLVPFERHESPSQYRYAEDFGQAQLSDSFPFASGSSIASIWPIPAAARY